MNAANVQIPATPAVGSGSTPSGAATSQDAPSTAGFLQVLDLLLSNASVASDGSSPGADLFTSTSILSGSTAMAKPEAQAGGKASTDGVSEEDGSLDPTLCSNIAALLQGLGFQVRPEQIAELSPLDQEQLGSALEFAERNLSRGVPSQDVAENMSLLLPRPWPLDDLDGSPTASTAPAPATTAAAEPGKLPDGFVRALETARSAISAKSQEGASSEPSAVASPPPTADMLPTTGTAKKVDVKLPIAEPIAATTASAEAQVATNQAAAALASNVQASTSSAHRVVPGGTTSEFIGRQVLEKVQVQLSEGRKELSLRLWPEELGEVKLSLRMDEGSKVQAHMVVENDSVRQAMLDAMPQLKDALSRHGMELERLSVSVGHGDAGSTGSGSASGDGEEGRKNGTGRNGRGQKRGEEIAVALPLVLGRDTGRRDGFNTIDLWS